MRSGSKDSEIASWVKIASKFRVSLGLRILGLKGGLALFSFKAVQSIPSNHGCSLILSKSTNLSCGYIKSTSIFNNFCNKLFASSVVFSNGFIGLVSTFLNISLLFFE